MKNFLVLILVIGLIVLGAVYLNEYYAFSVGSGTGQEAYVVLQGDRVLRGELLSFTGKVYVIKISDGTRKRIPSSEIQKIVVTSVAKADEVAQRKISTKNLPPAPKIQTIAKGGPIDIEKHLIEGYVVVFDFYADWCGPCLVLGPKLEDHVKQYDDVILRKIDIVNWQSQVCRQYGIQFVPNVRVYDKGGKMVGSPTSNFSEIISNIKKARE